ncbi:DUF6225 family protein [Streptomyces brevispora]|uniref:DUF6225 family protein n=1 Tax=Streptomyces brevispora TaxID=887462 RepID=UPI0037109033
MGELRQALVGLHEDTPLLVYAPVAPGSDAVQDHIIVAAGFGSQDDGEGSGPHQSREFQIGVAFPDSAFYRTDR